MRRQKFWNDIAREKGLPRVDFKLGRKRQPYTLPWDEYPASLYAEVRELLARLGDPDFLSVDDRPPLRPATLQLVEFRLKQLAAALVHQGRRPGEIAGLRDLCTLAAFKDSMRFFRDRAGGKITLTIIDMAQMVYRLAKHSADADPVELADIGRIVARLKKHRRFGLTEKNQRRLSQFDAPRNRDGFLMLPRKLHHLGKRRTMLA